MPDQNQSQHMLECEARYWLRRGYTRQEKVEELKETLKMRGGDAVNRLIEEMRRQWVRRHEWLGGRSHGYGMWREGQSGDSRRGPPAPSSTLEAQP